MPRSSGKFPKRRARVANQARGVGRRPGHLEWPRATARRLLACAAMSITRRARGAFLFLSSACCRRGPAGVASARGPDQYLPRRRPRLEDEAAHPRPVPGRRLGPPRPALRGPGPAALRRAAPGFRPATAARAPDTANPVAPGRRRGSRRARLARACWGRGGGRPDARRPSREMPRCDPPACTSRASGRVAGSNSSAGAPKARSTPTADTTLAAPSRLRRPTPRHRRSRSNAGFAYSDLVVGRFRPCARDFSADPVVTNTERDDAHRGQLSRLRGPRTGAGPRGVGPQPLALGTGSRGPRSSCRGPPRPLTGARVPRRGLPGPRLHLIALDATLDAAAGEQLAAHRLEWDAHDRLRLGPDRGRALTGAGGLVAALRRGRHPLRARAAPRGAGRARLGGDAAQPNVLVGGDFSWRVAGTAPAGLRAR